MFTQIKLKSGFFVEVLGDTFGPELTPCEWARTCPDMDDGSVITCSECPASPAESRKKISHAAALKWWREN